MFLNEEFLTLYETLGELNEAKADTQRLVDFAGEELANRFLVIKNKLKAPENDLYYWIKNKTIDEFESAIVSAENEKSTTARKRDLAEEGAKLVCDTAHWKVYHITTFEAAQKYGRDTKWCITGINDWGDKYWTRYAGQGMKFYFLITKDTYDPRGTDSKIAIAVYPDNKTCEVYNQQDALIPLSSIPHIDEINISGIAINDFTNNIYCFDCEKLLSPEEVWTGLHNEVYCEECFKETYFKCAACSGVFYNNVFLEDKFGNRFCHNCGESQNLMDFSPGFYYELISPQLGIRGVAGSVESTVNRLTKYIDLLTSAERSKSTVIILSNETGEIVYDEKNLGEGTFASIIKEIKTTLENY